MEEDHEERMKFVNWYCQRVCAGEIHHQLIVFSDEAWFHLSAQLNAQIQGTGLQEV